MFVCECRSRCQCQDADAEIQMTDKIRYLKKYWMCSELREPFADNSDIFHSISLIFILDIYVYMWRYIFNMHIIYIFCLYYIILCYIMFIFMVILCIYIYIYMYIYIMFINHRLNNPNHLFPP